MSNSSIRVGFVPEHFSTPLVFAKRIHEKSENSEEYKIKLIEFPSGTGHLIESLGKGEIDIGIGLTEAWISGLGNGKEFYRIFGTYVTSPLKWAISVGNESKIKEVDDLKEHNRLGISRKGSGSHTMSYVLAHQKGWITGDEREPLKFVELQNFKNLRDAVNKNSADAFMWEYFTSKKYFDSKELKQIGEILTPWSSWLITGRTELSGDLRVENFLHKLNQGIDYFERHQEEAAIYINQHLDYSLEDAKEWLKTVKFSNNVMDLERETIHKTVDALKTAGVIARDKEMIPEEMIGFGTLLH